MQSYKIGEKLTIINYFSNLIIPFTILLIVSVGVMEKVKVFDIFLDGAKEGIEIVVKIFPTLIGLFIAVGLLRSSGVLEAFIHIISPITKMLQIPSEVMPLGILRPISRRKFNCNWNRYYEKLWCR